MFSLWFHAGTKIATFAEKMNYSARMLANVIFLQCKQTSYPMKSQRKLVELFSIEWFVQIRVHTWSIFEWI